MKELWTAQVHLLMPPAEFGDTKCLTNVVAWAEDADHFAATVSSVLAKRAWSVLSIHQCQRAAAARAMTAEHTAQVERAHAEPDGCIFGTLHDSPSKPSSCQAVCSRLQ